MIASDPDAVEIDDSHIKEDAESVQDEPIVTETHESAAKKELIDLNNPIIVSYCPHCSLPCEFCQFGNIYTTKCLPWIQENCPEILSSLSDAMAATSIADDDENVSFIYLL